MRPVVDTRGARHLLVLLPVLLGWGPAGERAGDATRRWGAHGHEMAARAAIETLPQGMPSFFRGAADQIAYLDPEPDRWRRGSFRELDEAMKYDHYINFENIPPDILSEVDRFAFLAALHATGLEAPQRNAGLLPFRIVELYQRLVVEWRLWNQAAADPERQRWIEERIVNDAGILGHYVTDGAQPHHTTIHHNGWDAEAPNPQSFTLDRSFHVRFEGDYVDAFVELPHVRAHTAGTATPLEGAARTAVMDYLQEAHEKVATLYAIERDVGFDPAEPLRPVARDFAAERLGAGASMLATLWWSAWLAGTQ